MSGHVVAPKAAWAGVVKQGQRIGIAGRSTVHVVAFAQPDIRERFDDARTRGNPGKLFISAGDFLLSKANRKMLKIVDDGFDGRHDLATGVCRECRSGLAQALRTWSIPVEDIPASFNLFKTVEIDGKSGRLTEIPVRLAAAAAVELEAQMDCVVAVGACAEPATVRT
jgi:uncharacterized protein YcgI (DUF1989 family)